MAPDLPLRLPCPHCPAHHVQGAANQIGEILAADRERDLNTLFGSPSERFNEPEDGTRKALLNGLTGQITQSILHFAQARLEVTNNVEGYLRLPVHELLDGRR
jgi:hypothetical protein